MEEMTGKTGREVGLPAEIMDKLDKQIENVLKTGQSIKDETYLSNKNGNLTLEYILSPVKRNNGEIYCVLSTVKDITKQKEADQDRYLNSIRMKAMINLYEMSGRKLNEITDYALEQLVLITGSKIGYLAFLNDYEDVFTMHSWSRTAMKKCEIENKPIVYPLKTTGLWGEAVRQRRPIITNDYSAPNSWKKGYPSGHVPLKRHMNVPIFDGNKIMLVAGVGNKNSAYHDGNVNQIRMLMNFLWSIIKHQKADESLKESVNEKEVLLREIHHRVKNNLQVISSLISLQSDFIKDTEAKQVLKDTHSRIGSMALIHQKLYQSDNFSKINFSEYLIGLTSNLMRTHVKNSDLIRLDYDLGHFILKMETAIPLALITNELITNSLKHAFPNEMTGEISIKLYQTPDNIVLIVKDNGVGLPEDIDYKNADTMGFLVLNSLVAQLGGTIELEQESGTNFKITFQEAFYEDRI